MAPSALRRAQCAELAARPRVKRPLWGLTGGLLVNVATLAGLFQLGACADARAVDTALPPLLDPLGLIGFNVQADDALLRELQDAIGAQPGEAIWGFSEVPDAAYAVSLASAAADPGGMAFEVITGSSGAPIRMALAWDPSVLTLLDHEELFEAIGRSGGRAPLVGHFLHEPTLTELKVVTNHLWRGDADARHAQAAALNRWAASESLPLIAIGDFNFDWVVPGGETNHDAGYDLLIADDVWRWVRPDPLIPTQCSRFNSVLDFSFVAGPGRSWDAEATILFAEDDYCPDTPKQSDHRPVRLDVGVPMGTQ